MNITTLINDYHQAMTEYDAPIPFIEWLTCFINDDINNQYFKVGSHNTDTSIIAILSDCTVQITK